MNRNGSILPGIVKKMIKNVLGGFSPATHLHRLSNPARFQVVDVPADDLLVVVAKNNLPKVLVSVHPLHETQEPLQGWDVIFRPERIAIAKFSQALKQRFDIKLRGVKRRLALAVWIERESRSQVVGDVAKRFSDKLQAGAKCGAGKAGHRVNGIVAWP